MQSPRSPLPGIILIVLGVLFLIANFADVHLGSFWPIFVLGLGVAFIIMFFRDRNNYGVLMPGTILTVIGILFFACTFYGWDQMEYLWPFFIIAPGLGFLMIYLFGKQERGLLIPAGILTGLGLVFLLGVNDSEYLWPGMLILVGILFLIKWKKESPTGTQASAPQGPVTPAP
ncbi:hypothetical protein EHM92_01365 [bacterium]|nr:MAG: hypothetical protein EHM92_01365 [bacterium]